MASSCWFFWSWWLSLMLVVVAAEDQQVESCPGSLKTCGNLTISEDGCSGSCGNLTISDPFWLADLQTGRSCGSTDFEITCLNNTPVLPSSKPYGYGFTILDISYENHTMRVVDQGKLRLLPPPPASKSDDSCNEPIWNSTEKLHRQFKVDPVVNLNLIIYNCTNASAAVARSDGELVETGMRCGDASEVFVGVEEKNEEASAVEGCVAVVLPVLARADGEADASDYEQLISSGFVLTWKNPPLLARREKAFTKIVLIAKLCHAKESKLSMTCARGTIGFIAPEVHYRTFGVVSTKSDVYSYGMMLLEMVGGRRNVKSIVEKSSEKYFPDWIYDHFAQDDGLLVCEVTCEMEEIAKKMILIGLWCIQVIPSYRPTITKVLEMFERSLEDLDMPPKQNFCELLESSDHKLDVQSASSTRPEEISLVNSKISTTTANCLS